MDAVLAHPVATAYARIALPTPLATLFDYAVPEGMQAALEVGMRVSVSFGRRKACVGVVVAVADQTDVPAKKIKYLSALIDTQPLLSKSMLALLQWISAYYHYPLGEVVFSALPPALRAGGAASLKGDLYFFLSQDAMAKQVSDYQRAPKQQSLWALLQSVPDGMKAESLWQVGASKAAMKAMEGRGDVLREERLAELIVPRARPYDLVLNDDQKKACAQIFSASGFAPFVLQGVTGSGKTEVYFQIIARMLAQGRSCLVVVPEIALTPQTVARFEKRFEASMVVLHSALNATERAQAWLQAVKGRASIVIGTRSAILTPLPHLGLIVLDEEHDASFKQQSGFRYSARDVGMVRAQQAGIPIVLGSATPSLESLHQVILGRYQILSLPERAGGAEMPSMTVVDCRQQALVHGLASTVCQEMSAVLAKGQQVLVFLNRRGYAPVLQCPMCGWICLCQPCDRPMVLHQRPPHVSCHHCGVQQGVPPSCPECGCVELSPMGAGTERLAEHLAEVFPKVPLLRVDRDSTRRKGAMDAMLAQIHRGGAQILLGTQMLAKGHHFPDVTLVVILNVDNGLFSVDFRATERMGQLIVQVAGRAGRASQPGRVLLQTHHPDHPLLQLLLREGYTAFADALRKERVAAGLPPATHLALLHAEDVRAHKAVAFLSHLSKRCQIPGMHCLGPVPAPMAKRDGRHRFQLMLVAEQRVPLHHGIRLLRAAIAQLPARQTVRWQLDVDPVDVG